MKVSFEVQEGHIELWEQDDWRYAFIMGGRGNGRSGTASRYVTSRLLGKEYTRGAIMRAFAKTALRAFLPLVRAFQRYGPRRLPSSIDEKNSSPSTGFRV